MYVCDVCVCECVCVCVVLLCDTYVRLKRKVAESSFLLTIAEVPVAESRAAASVHLPIQLMEPPAGMLLCLSQLIHWFYFRVDQC